MLHARARCTLKLTRDLFCARHASTSSNPYPYPVDVNPTPYQIFHLPRSAQASEVKARYYELVRIYHPDSPVCRGLPAETTQARFHAIKAAYDALRGKTPFSATGEAIPPKKDYHDLSTAMWRAKQRRRAELNIGIDDKWKDRLMLGVLSLTLATFVGQAYYTRTKALAAARADRYNKSKDPDTPKLELQVDSSLSVEQSSNSESRSGR